MPRPSHLRGPLLGLLVVWCTLAALLALRPYRLEASCLVCPNAAAIDREHRGLRFAAPGLARVAAPGALDRLATGDGLSIEMWVTPDDVRQGGPARIATLSRDPYRRNVTVGQEGDALVFRLRTTATDPNGLAGQLTVPGFFTAGRQHHVAIAWDSRGTTVHLDGAERARAAGPSGSLSGWDEDLPLVLGNEPTGDRPWLGAIDRIVLRAGPVATGRLVADIDFTAGSDPAAAGVVGAADLHIPRRFVRFDPWVVLELGDFGLDDVVLHVGMMLPIGFLTTLLAAGGRPGRWRGVLVGSLVVAAFAIGIEIAQYFFVGRSASVYDLASGLAGGAAGIAGAAGRRWRWQGRLAPDVPMRGD